MEQPDGETHIQLFFLYMFQMNNINNDYYMMNYMPISLVATYSNEIKLTHLAKAMDFCFAG